MAIKIPFLRTPWNYDRDVASEDSGLKCLDPSLTVQSEKDSTDINLIIKRFSVTGVLPEYRTPTYGDFTGLEDFKEAADAVVAARENFMALDADLRLRFNNDPQLLLEFVSKVENRDEAIKLGLVPKPVEVVPVVPLAVRVVADETVVKP